MRYKIQNKAVSKTVRSAKSRLRSVASEIFDYLEALPEHKHMAEPFYIKICEIFDTNFSIHIMEELEEIVDAIDDDFDKIIKKSVAKARKDLEVYIGDTMPNALE